jgi:hypothetical protein
MRDPQEIHPAPFVLRDLMPYRGEDALFDERFSTMERTLAHPGARVTRAKRNRVTLSVPGSDDPHSIVIRNSYVGGRDGDGGQTVWLCMGRSIMVRIEDLCPGAGQDDLRGFDVERISRRVMGMVELWRTRRSSGHRDDGREPPTGPRHDATCALLDAAMSACTNHVSVCASLAGVAGDAFVQILVGLHETPEVVVVADGSTIGKGHVNGPCTTRHPEMSKTLGRLVDQRLRGCMIARGTQPMHVVLRPSVPRTGFVGPADPMHVLRHHADPVFSGLPTEFD